MKQPTNGHRWTDDELRLLIDGWESNVPANELASCLKVSAHALRKMTVRLRAAGVPLRRRAPGHIATRRNKLWSQSEVEYLLRRRDEGISSETIGSEMGRSFLAVQGMVAKLRRERVPVKMLGSGTRRLWNADALKALAADPTSTLYQGERVH
jgi:biotin operon repressor